jgi:hypothetical protein
MVNLNKIKRKTLDQKALDLNIDPKKFKNKKLLYEAIEQKTKKQIYNKTEPCTLEPIENIDKKFYVEWEQYGHLFAADARSIHQLFNSNNTILPWAIDFASGIDEANDSEMYKKNFDMKNNTELVEKLKQFQFENNTIESDVPFTTTFLFEMEKIIDIHGYTHSILINRFINARNTDVIYQRLSRALFQMSIQLTNNNHIYGDIFYQYCYIYYSSLSFHIKNKNEHLLFILQMFQQLKQIIGPDAGGIINTLLMDMS